MDALRTALVIEQTLGHRTHYQNLRDAAAGQSDISPVWLPIEFDVRGAERFVPLLRSNWSVRASWRARGALGATLKQQPLDAIFFHTQVTALFSRNYMRRIPSVISLDATPINYDSVGEYYQHRPAGTGLVDRQKHEMNRLAFKSAEALITWSEWTKRSLVDDYGIEPEAIRVISPGAAPAYFELGARRKEHSTQAPSKRVRLLFVGGDFVRKGGPLLLECMRGSLGEYCDLEVVTQAEIPPQPHVRVHKSLGPNSPELRGLFESADIFVLPTHADCLALVLMEAAAAGLPVVSTNVGALGEAFVSGKSGLSIPAGDQAALASAVTTLVDDPVLRQQMGFAGNELARKKFDAQLNDRQLLNVVVQVAAEDRVQRRAA